MELSQKIYELRAEKGLSQQELAERLDVSRQSVSKWETGQAIPDLDKLIRLADLFGITVDQLVREGERPEPPKPETIYVERRRVLLTTPQKVGVIFEIIGAALALLGIANLPILLLSGVALVISGLPLLLCKKHPWLCLGWVVLTLSLLVLNPYTSVAPWGLVGGLKNLYYYLTVPALHYSTMLFAALVGILRGTLILFLLYAGWRCWKRPVPSED